MTPNLQDSSQVMTRRATSGILHTTRPFGNEAEDFNNDSSRPRKVHHEGQWKPHQDAVCCVNFGKMHKRKDYNSGRQGPTPLSFTIQCRSTALQSGMPSRRQNFISESFHASFSSKDSSQRCLAEKQRQTDCGAAATITAAARHTIKQRETACGAAARHTNKQREPACCRVARAFFCCTVVCAHPHIFMRVHIHESLKIKSCHKGVCCTCIINLQLAFSI